MKRLKPTTPSANPIKLPKLTKIVWGIVSGIAVLAIFLCIQSHIKAAGPHGTITDVARITAYDAEFADYIGPGHKLAEYHYVDAQISQRLGFGYGPLYDVAGYQVIIGKTGAVGAIAYGNYSYGEWHMYPGPDCDWTSAFILVFDGCVAPEEWWSHPVLASMLYGVPTTDSQYLPELMVWVPWPDWFDFDNPPADAVIEAQSWYWNGNQYVPSNFVNGRFPLFSSSPISTTAPARGLLLWLSRQN